MDTLASLRDELGTRPLVLLVGADALLDAWHRWHELFALEHVGVLSHPDTPQDSSSALRIEIVPRITGSSAAIHAALTSRVIWPAVTLLAISATRLRDLLRDERDPRCLSPPGLAAAQGLLAPYRRPAD